MGLITASRIRVAMDLASTRPDWGCDNELVAGLMTGLVVDWFETIEVTEENHNFVVGRDAGHIVEFD